MRALCRREKTTAIGSLKQETIKFAKIVVGLHRDCEEAGHTFEAAVCGAQKSAIEASTFDLPPTPETPATPGVIVAVRHSSTPRCPMPMSYVTYRSVVFSNQSRKLDTSVCRSQSLRRVTVPGSLPACRTVSGLRGLCKGVAGECAELALGISLSERTCVVWCANIVLVFWCKHSDF